MLSGGVSELKHEKFMKSLQVGILGGCVVMAASLSMLYELALAQSMATVFGSTVTQYTLVIGLFLFGLGVGTWLECRWPAQSAVKALITVEVLLAFIGMVSPLALVVVSESLTHLGVAGLGLAAILIISILSGREIPLFLQVADQLTQSRLPTVLAWDFFGTCLMTVLFPLVLLPVVGLLGVSILAGVLNLLLAGVVFALGMGRFWPLPVLGLATAMVWTAVFAEVTHLENLVLGI